jgi:hypothetical protein
MDSELSRFVDDEEIFLSVKLQWVQSISAAVLFYLQAISRLRG